MISHLDINYKDNLVLDLHLPESEEFDLFIYFHGGGLVRGSHKSVEVFAETLAKNNIATASIQYSLYPDAKYPDFITDCAYSVKWLKDNISKYGKCKRVFVGGSSAGGYISMMLCFDNKYLNAHGIEPTDIDFYIHDAGQPTAHFNVLKEFGKDSRRLIVDETSPMYYVGTSEKYAPMLFIVSDDDMFGRYEQTMLMVKTLEHFGHIENVHLEVMHSKHCKYVYKADENGDGILANVILKYVK
ncbi:MAG: alpha/beta hydrolase [Clostridia bacterium]|nr:alpha/beta hydrolase [Clostridia bacterium]